MKVSKKGLRRVLIEIAIMGDDQPHKTMMGQLVPFGCPECVDDLTARIEDATYNRDRCARRSADRTHYNGLLNVFRRMLRAALKELEASQVEEELELSIE